jgi:uncharacterized phage protein (TIGR02220 family)
LKTSEFLKVLVTKSTSHQLIWLKILADGESVPLSILAKIGGVSKTQAHNIVTWGKDLQEGNSPKISQKPIKIKSTQLVTTSKNADEDKNLISQKVEEIITYLNQVAGKKFSPTTEDNAKPIRKRLDEKYSFQDFKHVIDVKTAKWKGTDMEDYLRPQTLFGGKFNSYLNESVNNGRQQTSSIQQTIDTAQRVAESLDWGVDSK